MSATSSSGVNGSDSPGMAIRHGVTIVPFAAIGADDAFKLAMDRDELKQTRLGSFLGRMGIKEDYLVPLPSSVVPTLADSTFDSCHRYALPSSADLPEDEAARAVRDHTRAAVARGIEALAAFADQTPATGSDRWMTGSPVCDARSMCPANRCRLHGFGGITNPSVSAVSVRSNTLTRPWSSSMSAPRCTANA